MKQLSIEELSAHEIDVCTLIYALNNGVHESLLAQHMNLSIPALRTMLKESAIEDFFVIDGKAYVTFKQGNK